MLYVYVLNDFLTPTEVDKIKIYDFAHAPEEYKRLADPDSPTWILLVPNYLWERHYNKFKEILDNTNLLFYETTTVGRSNVVILHSKQQVVYLGRKDL